MTTPSILAKMAARKMMSEGPPASGFTDYDTALLAHDIQAVATEEDCLISDAATLLTKRIGGVVNLGSYIGCLRAGLAPRPKK